MSKLTRSDRSYLPAPCRGIPALLPANPDFKPIEIKDGMDFEIWGVVTGSIRKYA